MTLRVDPISLTALILLGILTFFVVKDHVSCQTDATIEASNRGGTILVGACEEK